MELPGGGGAGAPGPLRVRLFGACQPPSFVLMSPLRRLLGGQVCPVGQFHSLAFSFSLCSVSSLLGDLGVKTHI